MEPTCPAAHRNPRRLCAERLLSSSSPKSAASCQARHRAPEISRNETLWNIGIGLPHQSALILAARITLAHFLKFAVTNAIRRSYRLGRAPAHLCEMKAAAAAAAARFRYANEMLWLLSGSERMRWPVAAKYALSTAGAATQIVGSPTPPQKPPDGMRIVSTFGISAMRITS